MRNGTALELPSLIQKQEDGQWCQRIQRQAHFRARRYRTTQAVRQVSLDDSARSDGCNQAHTMAAFITVQRPAV